MFRKSGIALGGAIFAVAAVSAGVSHAAEAKLRAVSCFPIGSPVSKPYQALIEEINKRGKGVVAIDLIGGAPKIGDTYTLVQKTGKGIYDMVGCTEAYFGNVVAEAPVLRFAEKSYKEIRKLGGMKIMEGLLNKKGLHYVGRYNDFGPFHLWLSQPIDKPDLTGLNLRVSPVYTAFFTSLGATVQTSNLSQIFTWMENNTVQGYGWPAGGWVPPWIKVTKFRVEPGFYNSALHALVNLRKWKALSAEARKVIADVTMEFEARSEPDSPELSSYLKKQKDWMASKGMKTITFTGADREKWLKAASDAGWKEVLERSPKTGAELKKIFAH